MLKRGDKFEVVINPRCGLTEDSDDKWITARDISQLNVLIRFDPVLGGEF